MIKLATFIKFAIVLALFMLILMVLPQLIFNFRFSSGEAWILGAFIGKWAYEITFGEKS